MNDKVLEEKICIDCGNTLYVTHGHVRRKPSDYKWRCKSCMKKYRSFLQRNSSTNIGNIINNKMSDPEERDKHIQFLSEKAKLQWNNMSQEDKSNRIKSMNIGHEKYISSLSSDELQKVALPLIEYLKNRTEEERRNHNTKLSESRINFFRNMNDEERSAYSLLYKQIWDNKSQEEKDRIAENSRLQWKDISDQELTNIKKNMSEAQKNRWNNCTSEERYIHGMKISSWYQNLSVDERNRISELHRKRWEDMTYEEKYHCLNKTFTKARINNNQNKLFEKKFNDSYISNNFIYVPEVVTTNNNVSKSWDYGIYNKSTNKLEMVVDIDGEYFHEDKDDYDGIHSREEYDERRMITVPDGIKIHIIYEKKFSLSFNEMIKLLLTDYDDIIEQTVQYCLSIQFPYPSYTNEELMRTWDKLKHMDCDSKYLRTSTNTRIGDKLITHFHPSIYHAHRKGYISPYDAWSDKDILRKCVENRIIYVNKLNPNKILQGFNISKIAPKVSVFSAGRAKLLIYKYLNEFNEIFDPFSGFGGRMLGAISLGKRYIGQDISDNHIRENIEMINFIGEQNNVYMSCDDIFCSNGEYESLFTCPPYDDKEFWININPKIKSCDDWIDECIKRFKCKRYLFVIDNTEKYIDNIVNIIINKSHFGTNNEYVIMIDMEV